MDYDEFLRRTQDMIHDADDIYISPDFQCDQTGGYPTYLCVSWEHGKAWLDLNMSLAELEEDTTQYDQMCAEFGIRDCADVEQYNRILEELGEDAMGNAFLPVDEEGMIFT